MGQIPTNSVKALKGIPKTYVLARKLPTSLLILNPSNHSRGSYHTLPLCCLYDTSVVAQRVKCWTRDQQIKFYSRQSCVTTLGKLFTPMCLYHQAV